MAAHGEMEDAGLECQWRKGNEEANGFIECAETHLLPVILDEKVCMGRADFGLSGSNFLGWARTFPTA